MKLNVPEVHDIKKNWAMLQNAGLTQIGNRYDEHFKVYDRHGTQVHITDWYWFFKDPNSSRLAFRIQKAYWAKGRKMRIESDMTGILSGEYVVVWKAVSNSYDQDNFVVVEFDTPVTQSPKQALAWLEQRMAELEAKDGITVDKIIQDMRVR